MTPAHTTPTQRITVSGLEAEFTGWHVWRTTDAGTWWATRRGPGWQHEPRTLAADSAEGLRAALADASSTAETRL